MAYLLSHLRIFVASGLAVVIIVGSFVLAGGATHPATVEASTETALLQAIATKDTDSDGLPDWQEALYGTSPTNPDSKGLGMTDGDAVTRGLIVPQAVSDIAPVASGAALPADGSLPKAPAEGTLTAAFAKNFLQLYVSAKQTKGGANLSESEISDIANQAVASLSAVVAAPDYKKLSELNVSGTGPLAMKLYAADAERVLVNNQVRAQKTELRYLEDAVKNNDASAIAPINALAKAYRESAVGLAAIAVPEELASEHLNLVNALMHESEAVSDFARVYDDPLAAMLALQEYPKALEALAQAFIHLASIYKSEGVVLSAGTSGASFVNMIHDILTEQSAQINKGKL